MDSTNNKDSFVLSEVVRALRENEPASSTIPENTRRAGVALILKVHGEELNVLLIQRAVRENDPWSGHIAFPGGHHEESDADLFDTVIRETQEEVGITLSPADYVSQLPFEKPYTSDQRSDLLVRPLVFVLRHMPELILNYEVSEVIWVPLERLNSGELLTHETVHFNNNEYQLPGFRLNDKQFVWGLTYRILQRFFSIIARS